MQFRGSVLGSRAEGKLRRSHLMLNMKTAPKQAIFPALELAIV